MYLIKKFSSSKFERINAILENHLGMINKYINLIASSTYPFPEVMIAMSWPIHVFPTEGMVNKRYFPAAKTVDAIEFRAQELLRELFKYGEDYEGNIQPHSGTQANQIAYNSVLGSEDKVLSLSPSDGGHISHKILIAKRNAVFHYHLDSSDRIDYDEIREISSEIKPKLIIAGGSSYPREICYERIANIAKEVNAFVLADISHVALFIMTGHHQSVFPHVDFATFNPIKNLRGPSGGVIIYRRDLKKMVERAIFPGTQGGPLEDVLLAKLVNFEMLRSIDLHAYAQRIIDNAKAMAMSFISNGLKVITGGTDSHLVLIDLRETGKTGAEIEELCEKSCVLVNRNLIPGDTRNPQIASGIRMGTACVSILGCNNTDAAELANAISAIILNKEMNYDYFEQFKEKYLKGFNIANAEIG